jgi:hypothetical protein
MVSSLFDGSANLVSNHNFSPQSPASEGQILMEILHSPRLTMVEVSGPSALSSFG